MIKPTVAILMLAVTIFAPAAALAEDFELTIENLTSADVISASARPGKLQGFKRVGAGSSRTFVISMPEGECEALVHLNFADSTSSETAHDVCGGGAVRITEVY